MSIVLPADLDPVLGSSLYLEINGVPQLELSSTTASFAGNLNVLGTMISISGMNALQLEFTNQLSIGIGFGNIVWRHTQMVIYRLWFFTLFPELFIPCRFLLLLALVC